MKIIILLAAVASFCVSGTLAIRCYECEATNSMCQDEFTSSNSLIVSGCSGCMKVKAEVNGNHAVQRGCVDFVNDRCEDDNLFGVDVFVCTCSTDLCNTGNMVDVYIIKAIGFVFLAWIVKYIHG